MNRGDIVTYIPTGERCSVVRKLKADGRVSIQVRTTDSDYARTYTAEESQLRSLGGVVTPFPPSRVGDPIRANGPPGVATVPTPEDAPANVPVDRLIWVNDPDLLPDYISNQIRGLGMKSAEKILQVRDENHGGSFKSVDDIPLRIEGARQYFSLSPVTTNPDEG